MIQNRLIFGLLSSLLILLGSSIVLASAGQGAKTKMKEMERYMAGTDFGKHLGRTAGEFIATVPYRYKSYYPLHEPPGKLRGFLFEFDENYVIEVYVDKLRHTKLFSDRGKWDLKDFLKERISAIVVQKYGGQPFRRVFPEGWIENP